MKILSRNVRITPAQLLLLTFATRLFVVLQEPVLGLNPHNQADAVTFASYAERIADTAASGNLRSLAGYIHQGTQGRWGLILAPFWLLPGPSRIYGGIFVAAIASFGVINVYAIGRYHHSHHAGLHAILPMILAPNFLGIHGSILRDGVVFFSLTSAARFLSIPHYSIPKRLAYPAAFLGLAYYLREQTLPIVLVAIAAGAAVYIAIHWDIPRFWYIHSAVVASLSLLVLLPVIRDGIQGLAAIREFATRGRTVYLPEAIPHTILSAMSFSWVSLLYFLFSPFPWMVEIPIDMVASLESMVFLSFTIPMFLGLRYMTGQNVPVTVGLLAGLLVGGTVWSFAIGNVGTAIRHRQMFLWIVLLFGGIGLAERIRVQIS